MSELLRAPKGTRDILPPESAVWEHVERTARDVFNRFGYEEIRTPIFESTELFRRGVGDSTDIVSKEMFTFEDKAGRSLTLRPESTAAVCRAYIEHGLARSPQPLRLYYIGPQFRHEKPQKGRYRQFSQIGVEYFGRESVEAEVEVLQLLFAYLTALGFTSLRVKVNTIGTASERVSFCEALRTFLLDKKELLSAENQARLVTNPLRIYDSKEKGIGAILLGAPMLPDYISDSSVWRFKRLTNGLSALSIPYVVDPGLVRGLDYYTNTVFEVISENLGAQNALCGGGAYEGLVEDLGGPSTYGVGFAIGEDRLVEAMPEGAKNSIVETSAPIVVRGGRVEDPESPQGVSAHKALRLVLTSLRAQGLAALDLGFANFDRAAAHAKRRRSRFIATAEVSPNSDIAAEGDFRVVVLDLKTDERRVHDQAEFLSWAREIAEVRR